MQELGKICVLGGDGRTAATAQRLEELGATVCVCGQKEDAGQSAETVAEGILGAQAVILPTPSFNEDACVYGCKIPLHARELFEMVGRNIPVWGGRISPSVRYLGEQMGVRLIDYMALEEVQLRNAIPSAEGAIALAMRELDVTLDGARTAVLGYGRIGKALAPRLAALGAQVSVAVRKQVDLTRVRCDGYAPIRLHEEELTTLLTGYDVIFNTVPARILRENWLSRLDKKTLLIELASAPGAWSPEEAAALGLRVIYAPGLPAKYAPQTAGRLIAEVLLPYLRGGEVPL